MAIPVMRKKFRFVGGQVDRYGTIPFATFAPKAEIQRVFHALIAPTFHDAVTAQHLEEQTRASARAVLLFTCGAKARTHSVAFERTAFADAEAALGGQREA